MSEMAEAIKELVEQKGLSAESVMSTIENMLKAVYKRTYGTNANAVVVFEKDENDIPVDVTIYSRKEVIDGGEDIDDVFDFVDYAYLLLCFGWCS